MKIILSDHKVISGMLKTGLNIADNAVKTFIIRVQPYSLSHLTLIVLTVEIQLLSNLHLELNFFHIDNKFRITIEFTIIKMNSL